MIYDTCRIPRFRSYAPPPLPRARTPSLTLQPPPAECVLLRSLQCWQQRHIHWVIFACGSMLVFTIGIPCFFVFILYSNQRRLLLQTPQCKGRYGFLYAKYQDRVWVRMAKEESSRGHPL